jgi:hypothetical protein
MIILDHAKGFGSGEIIYTKVTTQANHFSAALNGCIKLNLLKGTTNLNHFVLKSKLYLQTI